MSKNRFRGDYQLIEDADEKGRLRTTYRYKGPVCRFEAPEEKTDLLKKQLPAAAGAAWGFWILGMVWLSNAMHFIPAALSYVVSTLPLAIFTDCCFSFHNMKEPLENRHADRMNNRYPAACFFLILCSVSGILGGIAAWLRMGIILPGDLLYMAGASEILLTGIFAFRQSKSVRIRKEDVS